MTCSRRVRKDGYVLLSTPNGYQYEHIIIAERALGRPLPDKVKVHHANERRGDNRNGNLVICEDEAYHQLLHQRLRAQREYGVATARKCWICKRWDMNLQLSGRNGRVAVHSYCSAAYQRLHHKSLRKIV